MEAYLKANNFLQWFKFVKIIYIITEWDRSGVGKLFGGRAVSLGYELSKGRTF